MLVNEKEMITHKKYEKLSGYNFRIPLYQRKYAWSEDEVNALLEDLLSNKNSDYYIGNIVVEQREDKVFDVIDGQQRLTTLYLISKIAKVDTTNLFKLHYEIRKKDDNFLKDFENEDKKSKADIQFRQNIETILKFQKTILETEKVTLIDLLAKCKIALTILPKDVDIVKYFEVMNNRGKQLEKHQILKANILRVISEDKCDSDDIDYAKIWDYCSNMNVYIEDSIFYGSLKYESKKMENARQPLFSFIRKEITLLDIFKKESKEKNTNFSKIIDIINSKDTTSNKEEFYIPKEYSSIVKFPIFLIQVLKIFLTLDNSKIENHIEIDKIVVNDNNLLNYFNKLDDKRKLLFDCKESKEFILFLLRMRILYDYFIFKRDEKDEPYLDLIIQKDEIITFREKQTEAYSKQILMLQLLLNFSAPNYFAQDWLAVALSWLDKNFNEENVYSLFSEELEKFDRTMALERLTMNKDLTGLVNKYLLKEEINLNSTTLNKDFFENKAQINSGTSTPHYWFYKLDYLLWKNDSIWKNLNLNLDLSKFRLSRLNSIEHIYPQQPLKPKEEWNNSQKLNNFGNLALISNHMNSSLNNRDYNEEKRGLLMNQLNKGTIESLKMILLYSKYKEWTPENCDEHQIEMINLLIGDLNNAK
jgi:hypothetical protein